jgi:required for meiotic nuclear division protein 1
MFKVQAYQYSESIDLKSFKSHFTSELMYSSSDELFYKTDLDLFIYVFKYGVVCFLNYDEIKIAAFFNLMTQYTKNQFGDKLHEEFLIETNCKQNTFGYNKIEIVNSDSETLRLIMLNVSNSVALDYYSDQSDILLEGTNHQIQYLEKEGKLNITGKNLRRYIGRTLNLKNNISQNLYIFDSTPETWEDENLNKIDIGLKKTFDLQVRYKNIQEDLKIIKENLELFKDLMQYRKSNLLEWIIIILILIEVVNVFVDKIFR